MIDAETAIAAAGLKLLDARPYLAAAWWAVQRTPIAGIGTLGVDQAWRLYYDPEVVLRWSVDQVEAVLYHELCHLLRDHAGRGRSLADPYLWNLAGDAEINDDLQGEGMKLPDQPVFPTSFGLPIGRLAEWYYGELGAMRRGDGAAAPDDAHVVRPAQSAAVSSGKNRAASHRALPSLTATDAASASGGVAIAAGVCGSAATGIALDIERRLFPQNYPASSSASTTNQENGAAADGATYGGISAPEAQVLRNTVALAMEAHQRARSDLPGHWRRWAKTIREPKLDWRRELAAQLRGALADCSGLVDYSYRRPSRRQALLPAVVLPSLRAPLPRAAVVLDTSGSVDQAMLAAALSELRGILRISGSREAVPVLMVDAAVQAVSRVVQAEQVQLRGGGGTDMGVGIAAAERLHPRPDIVVVLTDGYTPWPVHPPRSLRTIVVLFGEGGVAPSWARSVRIDVEPFT